MSSNVVTITSRQAAGRSSAASDAAAQAMRLLLAGGQIGDALALLEADLAGRLPAGGLCRIVLDLGASGLAVSDASAPHRASLREALAAAREGTPPDALFEPIAALGGASAQVALDGLKALAAGYSSVVKSAVLDGQGAVVGLVLHYGRHKAASEDEAAAIRRCAETCALLRDIAGMRESAVKADKSLASLAAAIPGVVYQRVVSPDGQIRYTYISESAYELFGVTAERILNDPEALFQHYSPEYARIFRQRLIDASRAMTLWDVEAEINRPDGQKRYTHALARPHREPDGSVLWTGVILDATRIKEAELAASAAEARTREAIVESLSQGLLLFDRDDRLTLRNSHFVSLYPEMAEKAVVGAYYADVIRAELDPVFNAAVSVFDANDELVDRLMRHGEPHLVYERSMAGDRHILVNEYRTPGDETLVLYTDISELKRRERKIAHLAHHDSLTGLANRILFKETLEKALVEASQQGRTIAVVCLDLDRFKLVNDTLGHHVGDLLLKEVAVRIEGSLRKGDMAARLGGDEFAVIVTDTGDGQQLTSLSWRLLHAMAQPFDLAGHSIVSGTSIGIATGGPDLIDPETLLRNADLALYRAKTDGRGTFRFFEREMDDKAQSRRLLEIALRGAIARNELEVCYQPLVDTHTTEVVGAEALLRWNRPGIGYVPPLEFVPLAEETGMIDAIGDWVLKTACHDAATWPHQIRVAVNISPAQFRNQNFAQVVKQHIENSGLSPERLELEITESMLLRNTEANLKILHELKAQGIRISMDDFGTGYSSLGNLRSFPFSKIKIDKSFIGDLNKSVDAAAIIRAVLALGRSLGMTTTAEGVETRDQLAYLRAEGCVEVQGFYFAKAVKNDAFKDFIAEHAVKRRG
jgi:diguanylate cyclase (GGDEF)-like protein